MLYIAQDAGVYVLICYVNKYKSKCMKIFCTFASSKLIGREADND